jgi:hypothetical protein
MNARENDRGSFHVDREGTLLTPAEARDMAQLAGALGRV